MSRVDRGPNRLWFCIYMAAPVNNLTAHFLPMTPFTITADKKGSHANCAPREVHNEIASLRRGRGDIDRDTSLRRNERQTAQGLTAINAWYWDLNDETRAWSKRYQERHPKKMAPNHMQAGVYSATLHYLKAVDKVGSPADGRAVVAAMKAMSTDDALYGKGTIREDGRKIHPLYLLQVKTPEESKSQWDLFKVVGTIPADLAFRPLGEGGCPLVNAAK
jgi:Periplasmic binding protein